MPRAVRFSRTGGPEVLEVVEVAEPHPGPGRIRVAVRAAGLNPYDTKLRSGAIETALPTGQGSEFAGVVEEVGAEVGVEDADSDGARTSARAPAGVRVGDEVLGWTLRAAHADTVVVRADQVAPKPASLGWAVAGGVGVVADTAWRAAMSLQLGPSDTVLVTGAGGGVGLLSAQFALAAGATVVGTARASDHELLRDLGVVPVAYGEGALDRLRAAAPVYTAALDGVGRVGVDSAISLGIEPSRINSVAGITEAARLGIRTVGGGKKTAEEIGGFARAIAAGELVLPVQQTFPLEEVVQAYRVFETTHVLGKLVLTVP